MQRETATTVFSIPESWIEHGWRFRLYIGTIKKETEDDEEAATQLIALAKRMIRSRVISIIDPAEVACLGFAVASEFESGIVRLQIWWWSADGTLHREAIQGNPTLPCWERIPRWEVANARESEVLISEMQLFKQRAFN